MGSGIKMFKRIPVLVLALVVFSGASFASEPTQLSKLEVMAHLNGKTEIWKKGGAYFAPDGIAKVLWKGKSLKGKWWVKDNGTMCFDVGNWGKRCDTTYLNDNGAVFLKYKNDKPKKIKIIDGNQLDSL